MPSPAALRIEVAARKYQFEAELKAARQAYQEDAKQRTEHLRKVRAVLKEFRTPIGKGRATLLTIVRDVAEKYNVSVDDICATHNRVETVCRARGEVCYRAIVECPAMSLPRICVALGFRGDHTTVIDAAKRHCARAGIPYPSRKPKPWPLDPIRQRPGQR